MAVSDKSQSKIVLVPEAHALGMLGAIRSLGRAGYTVHAASPRPDAIGFASRYCTKEIVCPPFDSTAYVDWLRRYVLDHKVDAIIPGGAFLLAIEPQFEEFRALLPIAKDRHIVYRALSKVEVFEAFQRGNAESQLLDHQPPSLIVDSGSVLPTTSGLAEFSRSFYLKTDARLGVAAGAEDLVVGPLTPIAAVKALHRILPGYRRVLLQGAVTGRQAGVALLMDETGKVLGQHCFRDVHYEPTRHGTMSLRRSWQCPKLVDDAVHRLRHLGWQGAAMLEYRIHDDDDSFNFIELNPRYWQSLHLDLLAGVDFPRLQMAWFEGQQVEPPAPLPGVICRDLWPGEISRMLEVWRSPRFSGRDAIRETCAFLLRLLDPRIVSDYTFPGDRQLYWHRAAQVVRGWLRR